MVIYRVSKNPRQAMITNLSLSMLSKRSNEPCCEIMVLFVLHKLFLQTPMCSHPVGWCLIFGQTICLLPYFMCANSEGSGETVWMSRHAWAFAGHLCDKYHNLMSWLNYGYCLLLSRANNIVNSPPWQHLKLFLVFMSVLVIFRFHKDQ